MCMMRRCHSPDRRHIQCRPVDLPSESPPERLFIVAAMATQIQKRRPPWNDHQEHQHLAHKPLKRLAQSQRRHYTVEQPHRSLHTDRGWFRNSTLSEVDPMRLLSAHPFPKTVRTIEHQDLRKTHVEGGIFELLDEVIVE